MDSGDASSGAARSRPLNIRLVKRKSVGGELVAAAVAASSSGQSASSLLAPGTGSTSALPFSPALGRGTAMSPMTDLAYNLGSLSTTAGSTPIRRMSFSTSDADTPEPFAVPHRKNKELPLRPCPLLQRLQEATASFDIPTGPGRRHPSNAAGGKQLQIDGAENIAPTLNIQKRKNFEKQSPAVSERDECDSPQQPLKEIENTIQDRPASISVFSNGSRPILAPASLLRHLDSGVDTTGPPSDTESPSPPHTASSSTAANQGDDGEGDDGFLELELLDEDLQVSGGGGQMSSKMAALVTAPILNQENPAPGGAARKASEGRHHSHHHVTPPGRGNRTKRGLFRSPSQPEPLGEGEGGWLKRPDRPSHPRGTGSPAQPQNKKPRSSSMDSPSPAPPSQRNQALALLARSRSVSETLVDPSLMTSDPADQHLLLGDYSKCCSLPVVRGKHDDLKSISPQTLCNLMDSHYREQIDRYLIVDCRYPFEFEGGHIRGARNIYSKESILEEFLSEAGLRDYCCHQGGGGGGGRLAIVFHCEFSSERAPKLSRFLRNHDRCLNTYPHLHYPQLYLLHNGYKSFYASHQEYCEPHGYVPMAAQAHAEDLRQFRAKAKSWTAGQRTKFRTGLKF